MRKYLILLPAVIFILGGAGFLFSAEESTSYPDTREYAPNFWFDSEENYYPTDPLDFYYDESGNEVTGEEAVSKYNNLSLDEKINNSKIFYKVDGSGSELVYQYWLFYVMNNYENGHYGDWESIFVFVDKESEDVNKVVASAHGSGYKLESLETEHVWVYVGNGSHANCPSRSEKESCGFLSWNVREQNDKGKDLAFEKYEINEITQDYIASFGNFVSLDTQKSPTLGINLYRTFRLDEVNLPFIDMKTENYDNPPLIGDYFGKTPTFAWHKEEFHNPDVMLESTPTRLAGNIAGFFGGAGGMVASIGKKIASPVTNIFTADVLTKTAEDISEGALGDGSKLTTGLVDIADLNTDGVSENVGEESGEIGEIPDEAESIDEEDESASDAADETPDAQSADEASPGPGTDEAEFELALVSRVIDGDTVELSSGQRVRYIGINAPETPNGCFS